MTESEPDRVAWHLGMAAAGPDEAVAARLEQAAGRARERGGYAATVTFLSRAAELSADEGLRAGRLLAAAEAALIAGQPFRAGALLEEATPKLGDPLARAQARRLHGTIRLALGRAGEASSILLEAARALAPFDPRSAREALLEALRAALYVGWSASQAVLAEIADAARAMPGVPGRRPRRPTCCWTASSPGRPPVTPRACRYSAAPSPCSAPASSARRRAYADSRSAAWPRRSCSTTRPSTRWPAVWIRLARDHGALTALPVALPTRAFAEITAGRFDAAAACTAERSEITTATGNPGILGTAGVAELHQLAWRGRETDARRIASAIAREATNAGHGSQSMAPSFAWPCSSSAWATTRRRSSVCSAFSTTITRSSAPTCCPTWSRPPRAAARPGLAEAALGRLAERAAAAGTPLALGLLARSRALLASDDDAEPLYEEAIGHLKQCRARPQLARAHLVYGEWLRRQRRRRDARDQLRTAHEMFTAMGAEAFAERARIELLATGERARQRTAETETELTPQEAQIARLVSAGREQPRHRRAAVPQPLHRRLPPAQGVPEARRGIPHPARAHHGR